MKKYRIVYSESEMTAHYRIERKKLFFWKDIAGSHSVGSAESLIHDFIQNPEDGEVLKVYDESDLLVDKLKGK